MVQTTSAALFSNKTQGEGSHAGDRTLEKFHPLKIARRSYWLNAFLTKSKSILTGSVSNQWKIIKNVTKLRVTTAIIFRETSRFMSSSS